jgi:hypothetical protein
MSALAHLSQRLQSDKIGEKPCTLLEGGSELTVIKFEKKYAWKLKEASDRIELPKPA